MPHKLAPRSMECVLLGFPDSHKGYRCLDLSTNRIIISRHVVFDDQQFPFSRNSPAPLSVYDFLDNTDVDQVILGALPAAVSGSAGPSVAPSPGQELAPSAPVAGPGLQSGDSAEGLPNYRPLVT